MRLEQLEYLIEIAKQNSMSTASEQLHLAPQTLSISMKNLEKEMGFPIFERTSKGATMTEQGRLVLQFALKTVTEYHNIIAQCAPQSASFMQRDMQGTLTIYANPIFSTTWLPYYTRMFLNQYPNVKLSIFSGTTPQVCSRVYQTASEQQEKDVLGLTALPYFENSLITDYIPSNHSLFFKAFGTGQYYCCVSRTSPLAKHQILSLKKLLEYPIIIYSASESNETPLMYLLQKYNDNLNVALTVSAIPFWAQAVQDNLGIGFINNAVLSENSYLKEHIDKLVLIKVKEPLISINGFLYSSVSSTLMQAFMDLWPAYRPAKNEPQFESVYIPLYR